MNNLRAQQIKALQAQIEEIEAEESKERQKTILPYLKENAVAEYHEAMAYNCMLTLPKNQNIDLYKMVDPTSGSYHMHCTIAPGVKMMLDDGQVSLGFVLASGMLAKEHTTECLKKLKELGIRVSFKRARQHVQFEVDRSRREQEAVWATEKAYLDLP